MAPETSPPGGATRYLQTTRGLLSYSQLAPLLAERVLRVERDIAAGAFTAQALAPDLILAFHAAIAADLCPDWAGRWRDAEVRVGEHHPPPPYRVPILMRDYGEDLRVRLDNASGHHFLRVLRPSRETMTRQELQVALQKPYQRDEWLTLLRAVLPGTEIFGTAQCASFCS